MYLESEFKLHLTIMFFSIFYQKLTSAEFNAETWLLESFGSIFDEELLKQPGQDSRIVSQMRINNINSQEWDSLLNKSVEAARRYADKFLVAPRNNS